MQELGEKKEVVALFLEGIVFFLVCFGLDFWAFRYESYLWDNQ